MRKAVYCMTVFLLVALLSAGCGLSARREVTGTWYGDNADMLVMKTDGSYASTWLGEGNFRVEGEKILLTGTGMADGSSKELRIDKMDGKKVLREEQLVVAYYTDSSEAAAAKAERAEEILQKEEQRAAEELNTLKETLVGTWEWSGYAGEVTFGEDGAISGTVSGMKPGTYEVVDLNTIRVVESEREYTERIVLSKEGSVLRLTFGTLNLVKK